MKQLLLKKSGFAGGLDADEDDGLHRTGSTKILIW